MSFLNVCYITLCRLHEKHLILNEVKNWQLCYSRVIITLNYSCSGSLYCILTLLWQSKLLCFLCDLLNIQKCNFKECPFTWVESLTMFLPITMSPLWSNEIMDDSIVFIHNVKFCHLFPTIISKHIFKQPIMDDSIIFISFSINFAIVSMVCSLTSFVSHHFK